MLDVKKSAEVVDKLINHVCYKKTEGKLYLMTERLGWMTNTSEQFKISESYKNIRMQRISPDDKDKVQLQLLIHSGSSYTFHFVHPEGREQQMRDRNEVKNHLQHILPKFKDKATAELEHKKKLCEKDSQLLELYRELVAGKYICKEEFWARTESESFLSGLMDGGAYPRGVPSCLMTGQGESIASSEFTLSGQMIDDIFQVYPSVMRKYNTEVKTKKDREDFMRRFFQSHYTHRTRTNLSEDKFVSCADQDKKELRSVATELKHMFTDRSIDRPSDLVCMSDDTAHVSDETSSLELLRRFNRHTFMLLRAMERDKLQTTTKRGSEGNVVDAPSKKQILEEDLYREDELQTMSLDVEKSFGVPFNTGKVTEYINHISEANNGADRRRPICNLEEHRQRLLLLKKGLTSSLNTNRSLVGLISSSVATDVLTTVGHLFSDAGVSATSHTVPTVTPEVDAAIKALYRATSELLRHFWSCFPITDTPGIEKLHRMRDAIKKFKEIRLEQFLKEHSNTYVLTSSMDHKATEHVTRMLDTAMEAFDRYMDTYSQVIKSRELQ